MHVCVAFKWVLRLEPGSSARTWLLTTDPSLRPHVFEVLFVLSLVHFFAMKAGLDLEILLP